MYQLIYISYFPSLLLLLLFFNNYTLIIPEDSFCERPEENFSYTDKDIKINMQCA